MPDFEKLVVADKFRWHAASSVRVGHGEKCLRKPPVPTNPAARRSGRNSPIFISDSNPANALAHVFAAVHQNRPFGLVPAEREAASSNFEPAFLATAPKGSGQNQFLCKSSGSCGSPRWICRDHKSWIRSFEVNARLWGIDANAEFAVFGRLGYSLSLYCALESLHHGADLLLLSGLRPTVQFSALQKRSVSHIYATPTQLRQIGDANRGSGLRSIMSVSRVFVGGAKLDRATKEIAGDVFPQAEILEFYGSSETSFVAATSRRSPAGSVGPPYPGNEIQIRDQSNDSVPAGRIGEIWVRSPYLFVGYADCDSKDTRGDENGFITIGELGYLDDGGNLYVVGRKNRMVTIADRNVFPELIEDFLLEVDGIERAAAVPIADRVRGSRIVAFVLGPSGRPGNDVILNRCRKEFGPLAAPRMIFDLENWPTLPSGKTDFQFLEQLAAGNRI